MSDGTGSIYKRGNTYWIDYSFRGRRYRETTGSEKRSDAKKLLRRRISEMGRGKLVGPDEERLTFNDLCMIIRDEYDAQDRKSKPRLETCLVALGDFFGTSLVLEITPDRVDRYITHRRSMGRANSTIRNEVNALRRAMVLARKSGKLSFVPEFNVPPVRSVRTGFFSREDLTAVCSELPEYLVPLVRFAFLTGWRKAEVLGLTWAQVDLEAGMIRLEPGTTKNDEGREIPYRALPELDRLIEDQRQATVALQIRKGIIVQRVFHRDGQPIKDVRSAWNRACRQAGLAGAWFHDLRRSAVRNMERAGVSRSVAMKITGHKTESVYRRYAIADVASIEEGLAKLASLAIQDTAQKA